MSNPLAFSESTKKQYDILNKYDDETLSRMSTNEIPHYDQFVQHREPSLNTGLHPLPLQNMTQLDNQIHRSLDLLKQTDNLFVSNFNANSSFSKQINISDKPIIDSSNYPQRLIPTYDNFVPPRTPSLEVGLKPFPIKNMTILPNQIHNSLDLLHQPDQLNVSSYNKNSNYAKLDKNIVNSNSVEELEKTDVQFQGISQPFIPYPTYETPTALLNNFINDGTVDIIKEYICHINSIDRDINRYPNPFNFLVQFAPLSENIDASISRTFTNIRYIKIETSTLPRKHYINKTICDNDPDIAILFNNQQPLDNSSINDWTIIHAKFDINEYIINYTETKLDMGDIITTTYEAIYNVSTTTIITYKYKMSSYKLDFDKYCILYINDINDISQYSTDQNLSQAFNVLYPDILTEYTIYTDCRYVDKIYKFSELGNMSRMMLRITNSMGKDLTTNIKAYDNNISNLSDTMCSCTTDQYGNYKRNYKCICSYIRHPRYSRHQIDILFKLGIVETDFDKKPFN